MAGLLADLYGHQAWADAEHWRALRAQPGALADRRLFERLHHIHAVQQAFLCVAKGEPFQRRALDEFDPPALLAWAREYHTAAEELLRGLDDAGLAREVVIPWFPDCRLTLEQALAQAAMHTHYHRGQNATRLRELGGVPPLTDLIVWYWKARPSPQWP